MRIATLSIGDELTCGEVIDTNAAFIASALLEQGFRVRRHTVVGDFEEDIAEALDNLAQSSNALIVTGGLGPTADDITAAVAARVAGNPLELNSRALEHIGQILASLNLLYSTTINDKQAYIPGNSTIIPNPTGTACGFHLLHHGCSIFFLPGVPSEMQRMLHESVIPLLLEKTEKAGVIRTARFSIFGQAEAEIDKKLQGIAQPEQGLYLGICVTFPWMRVTVRVEAANEETAQGVLKSAADAVRERLKEWIFSEGKTGMEELVANLFKSRGLTLSLAESCTGGMIAQRVTAIPGSSAWFLEGAVTYSNAAKVRQLGVSQELLEKCGAVSSEVAEAMAIGIRAMSGSDLALSVTGIAGPDGGTDEKPVGTVFISLACPGGNRTERFQFYGSRDNIRILTAWTALDWLQRYLST